MISSSSADFSCADTLLLKSGEKVKGLILNEYKDRIVISTAGGERYYMKSAVKGAFYDDEYRELLQRARNEVKRKQYVKAYYTYRDVLKIETANQEAKEREVFLYKFLYSEPNRDIERAIEKRNDEEGSNEKSVDVIDKAQKKIGFMLMQGDKYVKLGPHVPRGGVVANNGGPRQGDEIIAVWGEMAAYMDVIDVAEIIAGPYESTVLLQRKIKVNAGKSKSGIPGFFDGVRDVIGADIVITERGLVVRDLSENGPFKRASIRQEDIVFAVNGREVSYMPIADVRKLIKNEQGKEMEFTIHRTINLWAKEDGHE